MAGYRAVLRKLPDFGARRILLPEGTVFLTKEEIEARCALPSAYKAYTKNCDKNKTCPHKIAGQVFRFLPAVLFPFKVLKNLSRPLPVRCGRSQNRDGFLFVEVLQAGRNF